MNNKGLFSYPINLIKGSTESLKYGVLCSLLILVIYTIQGLFLRINVLPFMVVLVMFGVFFILTLLLNKNKGNKMQKAWSYSSLMTLVLMLLLSLVEGFWNHFSTSNPGPMVSAFLFGVGIIYMHRVMVTTAKEEWTKNRHIFQAFMVVLLSLVMIFMYLIRIS